MITDKEKNIQKIINKIVLVDRKEIAASKHLNIALQKYDKLAVKVPERIHSLDVNDIKHSYGQTIEKLENIKNEQNIEIVRLKQQLKSTNSKIRQFQNLLLSENHIIISEADINNARKKRLRAQILTNCTGIYFKEKSPQNTRGLFLVQTTHLSMRPIEFHLSDNPTDETIEKMWELTKSASCFSTEWQDLILSS